MIDKVDKEQLVSGLLDEIRERALGDFYYFARYIMGNAYIVPHVHGVLGNWVCSQGGKVCSFNGINFSGRLMLIVSSRDLLKTTFITQYYVLWKLIRNRDLTVLIDSEARDLSMESLKAIKYIIDGNEIFRILFGDLNGGGMGYTWNQEALRITGRANIMSKEDSIETSGIDVAKTGRHYSLIIMDDLHSERNSKTIEQTGKVMEHIQLTLPLLNKDGELIIIGSQWSDSDAYTWAEELKDDDGNCLFDIFRLPAVVNDKATYPERLPLEMLAMKKAIMGEALYSSQYLCDPVPERSAVFKKSEIKYIATEKLPKDINLFMMCDVTGDKKTDTGSWFAACTWGLGKMNELGQYELYLIDGVCGGLDISQQISAIISLYLRTRPLELGIEKAGMSTLGLHLENALKAKGLYLNSIELKPQARAKNDRIAQFMPFARNGMIYINKSCDSKFLDEFLYEWQRFPKGKRSDCLDASAYIFDFARKYPPLMLRDSAFTKPLNYHTRAVV